MKVLAFNTNSISEKQFTKKEFVEFSLKGKSPRQRVMLLILRDLVNLIGG